MEICTCSECGIEYQVPENWYENRRKDHVTFYCPNGHTQHFPGRNPEEKLREERDLARASRNSYRDMWNGQWRSNIALRGHITRLRNKLDSR